jgi:hypothetical protein
MHDGLGIEIDNADTIVTKLGDKKPMMLKVNGKVIDAALHAAKRNLRFQNERPTI